MFKVTSFVYDKPKYKHILQKILDRNYIPSRRYTPFLTEFLKNRVKKDFLYLQAWQSTVYNW